VGLVFRITKSGAKSWSFRFRRASSKQTRATIGSYPAIGLKAARKRAEEMRKEVAAGVDPVAAKRQTRRGARSFSVLAERYLEEHACRHKRSHKADERNLNKHVLPLWKDKLYSSIKRADVIELIEGLISAGKLTLANRVQSLISTVFTFAMDAELVEANPCHRLRKRGVERVGRRVLSDGEIRLFWNGIIEPATARRTGLGLRLALLTGVRVGEVVGLCRAELEYLDDAARAVWTIPGERTKNLPLAPCPASAAGAIGVARIGRYDRCRSGVPISDTLAPSHRTYALKLLDAGDGLFWQAPRRSGTGHADVASSVSDAA
jgi:hypothetical protein